MVFPYPLSALSPLDVAARLPLTCICSCTRVTLRGLGSVYYLVSSFVAHGDRHVSPLHLDKEELLSWTRAP